MEGGRRVRAAFGSPDRPSYPHKERKKSRAVPFHLARVQRQPYLKTEREGDTVDLRRQQPQIRSCRARLEKHRSRAPSAQLNAPRARPRRRIRCVARPVHRSAAPVRECGNYGDKGNGETGWTYGRVYGAGIFNVTGRRVWCTTARRVARRIPGLPRQRAQVALRKVDLPNPRLAS